MCFRAVINGVLVESLGYERNARRNNYTVELRGGHFGLVKEFFVATGRLWAKIDDLKEKENGKPCGTIKKYILAKNQRSVPVEDIVNGPLMAISCGEIFSLIQHRPSRRQPECVFFILEPWLPSLCSYLSCCVEGAGGVPPQKE